MKNKKYTVLGLVAAAAAAFLLLSLNVQSQSNANAQMKLGGTFIGSGGGLLWSALQVPLDPAGRTAAIRINNISYGTDLAGLLAAFGADTLTEDIGQGEMISRDTFKWRFVGYGTKQGNPPLIQLIVVVTGTGTFNGPDSFVVNYTIDFYLPTADADGDGLPDPGTTPVLSIPLGSGTAKRVTVP